MSVCLKQVTNKPVEVSARSVLTSPVFVTAFLTGGTATLFLAILRSRWKIFVRVSLCAMNFQVLCAINDKAHGPVPIVPADPVQRRHTLDTIRNSDIDGPLSTQGR